MFVVSQYLHLGNFIYYPQNPDSTTCGVSVCLFYKGNLGFSEAKFLLTEHTSQLLE